MPGFGGLSSRPGRLEDYQLRSGYLCSLLTYSTGWHSSLCSLLEEHLTFTVAWLGEVVLSLATLLYRKAEPFTTIK